MALYERCYRSLQQAEAEEVSVDQGAPGRVGKVLRADRRQPKRPGVGKARRAEAEPAEHRSGWLA